MWIKAADPNSLIKFMDRTIVSQEWPMEGHLVPGLDIWLGGRVVKVHPLAMRILGPRWKPTEGRWAGRVDLLAGPEKYEIFRFIPTQGPESWFIRNDRDFEMRPWSQATLEVALMDLLA